MKINDNNFFYNVEDKTVVFFLKEFQDNKCFFDYIILENKRNLDEAQIYILIKHGLKEKHKVAKMYGAISQSESFIDSVKNDKIKQLVSNDKNFNEKFNEKVAPLFSNGHLNHLHIFKSDAHNYGYCTKDEYNNVINIMHARSQKVDEVNNKRQENTFEPFI